MELYYILDIIQFVSIIVLVIGLKIVLYILNKKIKDDNFNIVNIESNIESNIYHKIKHEQLQNMDDFEQRYIIKLMKLENKINTIGKSLKLLNSKEFVEKYEYDHKIFELQEQNRITPIAANAAWSLADYIY